MRAKSVMCSRGVTRGRALSCTASGPAHAGGMGQQLAKLHGLTLCSCYPASGRYPRDTPFSNTEREIDKAIYFSIKLQNIRNYPMARGRVADGLQHVHLIDSCAAAQRGKFTAPAGEAQRLLSVGKTMDKKGTYKLGSVAHTSHSSDSGS